MTLLLLFTCSIGAWAQGDPTQDDGFQGLELKHAFGDKATVTFYSCFTQGDDVPTKDSDMTLLEDNRVGDAEFIVAHIVPATGYWTNEALFYARFVANQSIVQNQPLVNPQTRGAGIAGSIEVTLISLDEGRNDGAGWYYFKLPGDYITYKSCILDGYVLPKFDLSGDALKSNDGKSFTFTVEDNWITELSIDVALTDETAFYYNASAQGPTKLTNTSIVVKRFDATENKYVEVVKFDGADNVAKHVTSALFAEDKSSLTSDKKAIDAGSYYLRLEAARTESNTSSQIAPAGNTRSGQNSATENTVETGIFTSFKDIDFAINQKKVEIVPSVKNKVYDGKKTAEIDVEKTTVATDIEGETLKYVSGLTAEFEDANVGTGKIVDITGTPKVEAGNDKTKLTNYDFTVAEGVKADITPKTIKDNPDGTKGEGAIAIVLDPTEYTYDNTAKEPAVTVKDGETTVAASEYNVAYKDNINAGTATVTITDKEGGNYTVSGTKTFTIKKAKLTITADAQTKVFGAEDPELTYKAEGLAEGDALTGALTRADGENVGEYAIAQGTLKATDNYETTFTPDKLTITAKTIKDDPDATKGEGAITIELNPTEYTYDNTAKEPAVTVKDGQTIIAASEYNMAYNDNINAGTATVTITDKEGGNYTVSGKKTFTIKQAALTITADAKEKMEGEDDPELTYTVTGLVEGDKLEGALTRETGEKAGTYDILQGTLKANDNYTITFTGAKLTITAKPAPPTPTEKTYRVSVQKTVGGEVCTTKVDGIKAGEQVNMIITPDEEYYLESLSVVKAKGGDVLVRDTEDGKGNKFKAFNMPADDAIVTAIFAKIVKPNENKQNIFIFKANYGEVISNKLYADGEEQVNLKAKGYEDCVLNELYVYNEKFEPLPISSTMTDEEGLIYHFVMRGEKAFVYNTFKGTNGTVDDSNPLPPDYRLYLFTNMAQSFLQTNKDSKGVRLALSLVANILATFNETGELKVDKGIEDMIMGVIDLKKMWLIKIDFEGTIKALAPQLLEMLTSMTRGTEEGTPLDSDGTILSGATYRVLEDTNLEFLLESTTGPLLIKSVTVMAPEDDDPTAISRLKADDADADIYDLSGRKVDATIRLPKGVYIRNGKKVVIK
jgi:hypothetical protein